ncbi:unnamed protein product [Arctia plantaginis]|uniref:Uncharacterized protein n=1 Tax=Arctia plantaginis TaxID=874455 RepID=A0A8S1BNX0_ARCPL|nr:unnamed protein product [Arctia plantaginis]
MSSASATSSKRETQATEMALEIESIRGVTRSLKLYLNLLREFKKCLFQMNDNFKHLGEVNKQWLETLNSSK